MPIRIMTKPPFKIRTITSFVAIESRDFEGDGLERKIGRCSSLLRDVETRLSSDGYEIQTLRVATNPFGEWLVPSNDEEDLSEREIAVIVWRLEGLNSVLGKYDINFCSLGPSMSPKHTTTICPLIVSFSPGRFSCSANIDACDVASAMAAATCVKLVSSREKLEAHVDSNTLIGDGTHLDGGLGNFRFCTVSQVKSGIPFFPAAKAASGDGSIIKFALGLENGAYAGQLLKEAKSIVNVHKVFSENWRKELLPIQNICDDYAQPANQIEYIGIDTSLNPSLHHDGSVARAIEYLNEVQSSFGQGSLSAAAAITTALQSIPDIKTTGYCGLMLPVLEDQRLSELALMTTSNYTRMNIQKLLCISSVCGVGVDTVPVSGDVSENNLSSLMLDVAALGKRWNKQLSCRVFPVPNQSAGEMTVFDSPYLCNSCVFDV